MNRYSPKDQKAYLLTMNDPPVIDGDAHIPFRLLKDPFIDKLILFFKRYPLSGMALAEIEEIDANYDGYDLPVASILEHPQDSLGIYAVKGWVPPHLDKDVGYSYILVLRSTGAIVHSEGMKPLKLEAGMLVMVDVTKPHRLEHGRNKIFIWAAYDDVKFHNEFSMAENKLRRYLDKWLHLVQKAKEGR